MIRLQHPLYKLPPAGFRRFKGSETRWDGYTHKYHVELMDHGIMALD